ncbi:hypothetical protein [Aestuariispira insulae]|uniref:Uncharacterized protein n=1 Tax=Aestuariispira insulae TaxID=1461337 RepID=A0A3D9H2F1_9PROT|nr:hypothetical protein [Aestuariispira insulae]RED43076.1 hypothetical protein DFP90_1391 [Aestuariispira insulae]
MADTPIVLDEHRGREDLKKTDIRRQQLYLSCQREKLECLFLSTESKTWPDAVGKALYLISLFAETREGQSPRNARLIRHVLCEMENLQAEEDET